MIYEEFEKLCKEAWEENWSYFKIKRWDDEEKPFLSDESVKDNIVIETVTDPFCRQKPMCLRKWV